ncbi:hypothetical protein J132_07098 [Termitomyces sp. J132]|nr:hypothetical protein H2248_005556 [Termitomyces sp. 'cryptogamus']KNZ77082.1 hypothetical protein J132_07098 [Termitomyces sp. J132]
MPSLRIVFFFLASALATLSLASPTAAERRGVVETVTEDVAEMSWYQRRGAREDAEEWLAAKAERTRAQLEKEGGDTLNDLMEVL